jgi:hypothetical protein
MSQHEFKGEIKVASRIVDYLSSGLYESPAACLKELINNSFDADATRVDVFIKPDADRIIIEDNGRGMDHAEFVKHFSMISESHKRDDSDKTQKGRPKIGKIGIGFIAANEICNVMEIVSTKSGSSELLQVTIRFDLMRQDPADRRRGDTDIAKADYYGTISETDQNSAFTQVFLKEVRGEAQAILARASRSKFASGKKSLYGLKPHSVSRLLKDKNIRTWSEFDAYSKNRLLLALNVPVRYHDDWLPPDLKLKVDHIVRHVAGLDFTVYIDGSELRKPILFSPKDSVLITKFNFNGEHVSANGYFFAQHSAIRPEELQGLLIRIRNTSVGQYDSSFLGFSSSLGPLFQSWISGEIMADDRLEDAMNIDRRTLRIDHPAYVELQEAVHNYLASLIKRVRAEIYSVRSKTRRAERASEVEKKIISLATQRIAKVAPESAKDVRNAWVESNFDEVGQKKLLRKFTVDELYEIVVDVAREILSPKLLNEFIKRLTSRLRR